MWNGDEACLTLLSMKSRHRSNKHITQFCVHEHWKRGRINFHPSAQFFLLLLSNLGHIRKQSVLSMACCFTHRQYGGWKAQYLNKVLFQNRLIRFTYQPTLVNCCLPLSCLFRSIHTHAIFFLWDGSFLSCIWGICGELHNTCSDENGRVNGEKHSTEWVTCYLQNAKFLLDFKILPIFTIVTFCWHHCGIIIHHASHLQLVFWDVLCHWYIKTNLGFTILTEFI